MKTKKLSIKELAAYIGVSTDTIRRAVRKGEIPATRVRTALRFDLHQVLTCMRRNAEAKFGARSACAPDGSAGRAQGDPPPSGKTGAQFPGDALCVIPTDYGPTLLSREYSYREVPNTWCSSSTPASVVSTRGGLVVPPGHCAVPSARVPIGIVHVVSSSLSLPSSLQGDART